MAPVMLEFDRHSVDYDFCWSGQHQETIDDLITDFGIRWPDVRLINEGEKNSKRKLLFWLFKTAYRLFCLIKRNSYSSMIVHGDTLSALVGACVGSAVRLKVVHVEAGLSSGELFKPFPEELVRRVVMSLSSIYFCQDQSAFKRVSNRGLAFNTLGNTLLDSARLVDNSDLLSANEEPYVLVSIHRVENLSRNSLFGLCEFLKLVRKVYRVKLVLHSVTRKRLDEYALTTLLMDMGIDLLPRTSYSKFMFLIKNSECMITDGGSNQEECFYLGHPCLIWRNETERSEGLGKNALLSLRDEKIGLEFINNLASYRSSENMEGESPSVYIAKKIIECFD
ncbi:UDP-N-acetyl glucosamine 2-epimerase [Aurantivibrio plasticivorans]